MGLDVYLYRIDDPAKKKKLEGQYERFSARAWNFDGKKYEQLTEAEKKTARAQCKAKAEELGLDEHGSYLGAVKIELDSRIHPKHMFKVGYFRSSYNDGGLNSVLRKLGMPSLDHIFDANDRYEFQPDWKASGQRAMAVLTMLRQHVHGPLGKYDVMNIRDGGYRKPVQDEREALDIFAKQLEKSKPGDAWMRSYICSDGEFFLDGIKVYGFIPGGPGFMAKGQTYVVYDNAEGFNWYIEALEVVYETITWVLAQKDKDLYWLHWSG